MTRFLNLAVTAYDDEGFPDVDAADDQWVNLDLVERVNELVTDNLFRRDRDADAWFPYLVLTLASGRELVVTLGRHDSDEKAWDALERFLPLVVGENGKEPVVPSEVAST